MLSEPITQKRWAPEIILALANGPRRFNRLLEIPGISDRLLTNRLRDLGDEGLVRRQVDVGPPIKVRYELTAVGQRYIAPFAQLAELSAWRAGGHRGTETARGFPEPALHSR